MLLISRRGAALVGVIGTYENGSARSLLVFSVVLLQVAHGAAETYIITALNLFLCTLKVLCFFMIHTVCL